MALVVLLKGINVGGHRTFRPSALAAALADRGVVNIGAAGTFVVRKPGGRLALRGDIIRRLPFHAVVMICGGDEVVRLAAANPFAGHRARPGLVRFVGVLARRRPLPAPVPMNIPARGRWCVRILGCHGRFVFGLYRRQMQTIGYLGGLDRLFGAAVTARNWSTFQAIARVLEGDA